LDSNSPRTIQYLEENFNAINIKLTAAESQEIFDAINAAALIPGDRYPANMMEFLFADTVELKE
jgi:hypothetical protein